MPLRRAVLVVLLPLTSSLSLAATDVWTSLGPPGGCVALPVVHPRDSSTLYVGDASGIVKSIDGGFTWQRTNFPPVDHLAIHPTQPDVLFGIEARRVDLWPNTFRNLVIWRSEDGGESWSQQAVMERFEDRSDTPIMVLDPVSPAIAYIAGCSVVWKTTDAGVTWQPLPLWGWCAPPAIAVDPRDPRTIYTVHGLMLFRSTDGGSSWSVHQPDLGIFHDAMIGSYSPVELFVDGAIPGTVYASSAGGVYRSGDGGLSWMKLPTPEPTWDLVALAPSDNHTLYAKPLGSRIARSSDAGETWQITGSTPEGSCGPGYRVDPEDPTVLWASNRGGRVLRSPDGGLHWDARGGGLHGFLMVQALVADPANPCRLYASVDGMGLVRSDDRGASWVVVASDIEAYQLVIVPGIHPTIYAQMPSGIVASTDAGLTWHFALEAVSLVVDQVQPTTLFATVYVYSYGGGYFNVLRSTDGGETWQNVVSLQRLNSLAIDATDHNTIIAGTDYGLSFSHDGGSTWYPGPLVAGGVHVIATDPQAPDVYLAAGWSMIRSTDGGGHWGVVDGFVGVPGGPSQIDDIVFDPGAPGVAFAATDLGVFRSDDHGVTWRSFSSGLAFVRVKKLAFGGDSGTLYATSNGGAFALDLGARACPPPRARRHLRQAVDRSGPQLSGDPVPANAP